MLPHLILLLPFFACLQPHVKSVEHLQSDYDRLQSLQISLERDLLHAPDPLKVENDLREVELRMRYIEVENIKKTVYGKLIQYKPLKRFIY